jgi:hypothetical protein
MYSLMSTKSQFKFQIEEDLRERVNIAAKRLGRDTAQEVVEEILTLYFPVWLAVADSTRRAVEYQTQKTLDMVEQKMRQTERPVHAKSSLAPVVAHIGSGKPAAATKADAQRMIDEAQIAELEKRLRPRKSRTIDHVEPVPDDQVHFVRNLGELSDERKQKPIRKKAGRK